MTTIKDTKIAAQLTSFKPLLSYTFCKYIGCPCQGAGIRGPELGVPL